MPFTRTTRCSGPAPSLTPRVKEFAFSGCCCSSSLISATVCSTFLEILAPLENENRFFCLLSVGTQLPCNITEGWTRIHSSLSLLNAHTLFPLPLERAYALLPTSWTRIHSSLTSSLACRLIDSSSSHLGPRVPYSDQCLAVVTNRNRHPEITTAVLRIHNRRKIKDPVFGILSLYKNFYQNPKPWFLDFLKISKNRTENFGFFHEHHRILKILKLPGWPILCFWFNNRNRQLWFWSF